MNNSIPCTQLPPGDPRLVEAIVGQLKSKGIFDQFRKECLADVDTKPAFQNLRQRVEGHVNKFLEKKSWKNDLNKNHLRDGVRKHVNNLGILDTGIDAIITQVVNPKIKPLILPFVEDTVYAFLQIDKPKRERLNSEPHISPKLQEKVQELEVVKKEEEPTIKTEEVPLVEDVKPNLLPMETDVISSEEDDILARESPEGANKSASSSEAEMEPVKTMDENAQDGFESCQQYEEDTPEGIASTVERLHLSEDDSKSTQAAKPPLTLFEDQSLDSISSNSSGLTFSPLTEKGSPDSKKSEDNDGKSDGSPKAEMRSTTSTPLVDEKPVDENSQSSIGSDPSKKYQSLDKSYPSDSMQGDQETSTPSLSALQSTGRTAKEEASMMCVDEDSLESKESVSKTSMTSEKADVEEKAKSEKSEGEISSSSSEFSDGDTKNKTEEKQQSDHESSYKASRGKSDHRKRHDSYSRDREREKEKEKDSRHHRDKERKHSKSRDDHHSHRDKDKKHHRRDKDHDGDRERSRSHHHQSSSSHKEGSGSGRSSGDKDKDRSGHHSSGKSSEGKNRSTHSSEKSDGKANNKMESKSDEKSEGKHKKDDGKHDKKHHGTSDKKSESKSDGKREKRSEERTDKKSDKKQDKKPEKKSDGRSDSRHSDRSGIKSEDRELKAEDKVDGKTEKNKDRMESKSENKANDNAENRTSNKTSSKHKRRESSDESKRHKRTHRCKEDVDMHVDNNLNNKKKKDDIDIIKEDFISKNGICENLEDTLELNGETKIDAHVLGLNGDNIIVADDEGNFMLLTYEDDSDSLSSESQTALKIGNITAFEVPIEPEEKVSSDDFEGFENIKADMRLSEFVKNIKTIPDELDEEYGEWFDDTDLHITFYENTLEGKIPVNAFLQCVQQLGAVIRNEKGEIEDHCMARVTPNAAEVKKENTLQPINKKRRLSNSSSISSSCSSTGSPKHKRSRRESSMTSDTSQMLEQDSVIVSGYALLTPEDDGNRSMSREYDLDYSQKIANYSPLSPASDSSADEVKAKTRGAAVDASVGIVKSATKIDRKTDNSWPKEEAKFSV